MSEHSESNLYARMLKWLDAEECRELTLLSANADFGGPGHAMQFATLSHEPAMVYGESREECFRKIEELTLNGD